MPVVTANVSVKRLREQRDYLLKLEACTEIDALVNLLNHMLDIAAHQVEPPDDLATKRLEVIGLLTLQLVDRDHALGRIYAAVMGTDSGSDQLAAIYQILGETGRVVP